MDGRVDGRGRQEHITIGQLAHYAGVTIRTIRHYHRIGLLDEPPRDASGYRRYSAADAIHLVKIRTLADAGVPLARIGALLGADRDRSDDEIARIDRDLEQQAERLRRTRERLARLRGGDRLFVSGEVADLLDRLRELGVSERGIRTERDGWVLMEAISPSEAATRAADKRAAIDDPEFRAIYLEHDAAFDWAPDDPRIEALADRTRRWLGRRDRDGGPGERSMVDPDIARFISSGASSPAWDRLAEIVRHEPR